MFIRTKLEIILIYFSLEKGCSMSYQLTLKACLSYECVERLTPEPFICSESEFFEMEFEHSLIVMS